MNPLKLIPPSFPKEIPFSIRGVSYQKQDGIQKNFIPVISLSREQAEEYAELLRTSFLSFYNNLKYDSDAKTIC